MPKFRHHAGWHFSVDVDHRDRLPGRIGFRSVAGSSQGEVRDVDLMLAEDCADSSDHAGHVAIAKVDQILLQRSFHIDAIDVQQPRGVLMQHCAFHGMLFARFRLESDR